ncbi:MAG TPA: vitamin B12 dependent-methionine synthase activation domain-containing protein [Anaerolineae bacterium]|nr:vitamin B12 dependent-methionine synthase activation domain-containing protein [Anaerolineae bacterium]
MNSTDPTQSFILDSIPFVPDLPALQTRLRIREGSRHVAELARLAAEAETVARPKALYKLAFIEAKAEDAVVIEGVRFTSRVLRVNLDVAHRVFAYIITCGRELDDWAQAFDDIVHRFWADAIKEMALRTAIQALTQHLNDCYSLGRTAMMSPGSLADWPIQEQRPLFALLGDTRAAIGVALTDSFLMIPDKSVSGIRFPTEESFESCQLCPRETCPGRRAPYDSTLFERKYAS